MTELKWHYETLRKYGVQIYALSVDAPEKTSLLVEERQLPFDLLCDVDRKVVEQYDLCARDQHGGIAYPALFIIDRQGTIVYRSLDYLSIRVDVKEIVGFLEKLQQDPTHQMHGKRKKWIPPSVKQFFRNWGLLPNPFDHV